MKLPLLSEQNKADTHVSKPSRKALQRVFQTAVYTTTPRAVSVSAVLRLGKY
jgi:hypothetical protein